MTTPLDLTKASDIARAFHKVFVARWPEYAHLASLNAGGDLSFEIPRGSEARPLSDEPLLVVADVDYDETIIVFGGGHSHGGGWREPGDPDFEFQGAVRFIEEIFDEAVVGYSTGSGGGGFREVTDVECAQDIVRVRSWRGTHDEG